MDISAVLNNYPNNCTFCKSKTDSVKCQLPFQTASELILNKDPFSAIIELTEIHNEYGLQNLIKNFKFNSDHDKNDQKTNELRHKSIPTTIHTEVSESDEGVKIDDSISLINSDNAKPITERIDQILEIPATKSYAQTAEEKMTTSSSKDESKDSKKSWDEMTQDDEDLGLLVTQQVKRKANIQTAKGKFIEQPSPKEYLTHKITANEEKHLIQDLALAAITARGIKNANRSHIKQGLMIDSIVFEMDVRSRKSHSYKPRSDISLDGQIGLSKGIIACHNHDQIMDWESGEEIRDTHLCILNHPAFKANDNEYLASKLDDILINYFSSIRRAKSIDQKVKDRIFEILKFDLERDKRPEVYQWIMTTSTSNRVPKLMRTTKRDSTSNTSTEAKEGTISSKSDHKEPVVDEEFLRFIDVRLMSIVKKVIKDNNELESVTEHQGSADKLFYKLVANFIKHTKSWQNENSFHSGQQMSRIEDLTGVRFQKQNAYLVFQGISEILKHSREKFKEITD